MNATLLTYGPRRSSSRATAWESDSVCIDTLILDKRRRFSFTLDPSACTISYVSSGSLSVPRRKKGVVVAATGSRAFSVSEYEKYTVRMINVCLWKTSTRRSWDVARVSLEVCRRCRICARPNLFSTSSLDADQYLHELSLDLNKNNDGEEAFLQ